MKDRREAIILMTRGLELRDVMLLCFKIKVDFGRLGAA